MSTTATSNHRCCIVCCEIKDGVETRTIISPESLEQPKFTVKKPVSYQEQLILQKKQTRAALKILVIATCVSFVFIGLQLYGGWLAGSIAVFADSAHLGSDILGFAISMISLVLAQKNKTDSLSYGWHRAEIIGTMISVASMWIMTVWLVVEGTQRFYEPPQVEGLTMLIVAIIGLIFNLIQIKILHSGDGHYHLGGEDHEGCGHDHDHGHSHNHDGHNHNHDGHGHSHNHEGHNHDDHSNKQHNHQSHSHEHGGKCNHNHGGTERNHHQQESHEAHNSSSRPILQHQHSHKPEDCSHDQQKVGKPSQETQSIAVDKEGKDTKKAAVKGKKKFMSRDINVDAAMLHVMGDCIMSIGVIIAAIIIYIWPQAWVCDPICTYLFAIIVIITTYPVTRKCIVVLMEGTPDKFDTKKLMQEIWALNTEQCKDIMDVHDLHVWSISVGKNALTVHIVSNNPLKTLGEVTDLCRRKFGIYHTVIQVEGPLDEEINPHGFTCENDIHA